MAEIDFVEEANALQRDLVAWRRDFHMHPELAFKEVRTAGIVAEELNKLGLEVQTGVGKTGVVAIMEGTSAGPTVLWRADMDALPIHEENEVGYASTVAGQMHACGHDGHTAIGLGIVRLLAGHREQLPGRIKFVFQPAEETVGGALAMIEDGVLEDPRPDVSLGLHLWNEKPVGNIAITDGPILAGSSRFKIEIVGKGGHAASPHENIDPVVCAAQIILGLQTIVSRNVDAQDQAVVTVTQMQGSDAYNITPERVTLGGTFRAFSVDVRDKVADRITSIASGISEAMSCQTEVKIWHGTIPTVNDPVIAGQVRKVVSSLMPDVEIHTDSRSMGAEDMSFLMKDVPGTYIMLGSNDAERGLDFAHHHPRFDFDEAVLPIGVAVGAAMIVSQLDGSET